MNRTCTYPPKFSRSSMGGYRYFFNGQEADNEVLGEMALHAFKYRMHDTRIGRFWSVDPLAGKFPWNSTYAFAENSPIGFLELEGLEAVIGISLGGDVNYRKGHLKLLYETAIVETIVAAQAVCRPFRCPDRCSLLDKSRVKS